jgi:metal-responsive CopG/Arc/MetJ family transcriptional regulator
MQASKMNVQISIGLPSEMLTEIEQKVEAKDRSKKIVKVLEAGLQILKTQPLCKAASGGAASP